MEARVDERICSTIGPADASRNTWDVIVIGAGPAGAVAAAVLARGGAAVLLIERQVLPRNKVCGGCVSAAALEGLRAIGIDVAGQLCGAQRLQRAVLMAGGVRAVAPLRGGVSVSRAALDAALVREAVAAGAHLMTEASARESTLAGASRHVVVQVKGAQHALAARVVVMAAGLPGRLNGDVGAIRARVKKGSRIGIGALLDGAVASGHVGPGEILMTCGRGGYVGMAVMEDGRPNVAAALEPGFVRRTGGPGAAVRATLEEGGGPAVDLVEARWRGTPPLSRRPSRVALERLLLVGDAAGYVEPFTGEGIAWAIGGAIAAAEIAEEGVGGWRGSLEGEWSRRHREVVGTRQATCGAIAWGLRRPIICTTALHAGRLMPALAQVTTSYLHRPMQPAVYP